jgi:hypothetical protein
MADPAIAFAALDRDSGERFQSSHRQLGVRSFGLNPIVLRPPPPGLPRPRLAPVLDDGGY